MALLNPPLARFPQGSMPAALAFQRALRQEVLLQEAQALFVQANFDPIRPGQIDGLKEHRVQQLARVLPFRLRRVSGQFARLDSLPDAPHLPAEALGLMQPEVQHRAVPVGISLVRSFAPGDVAFPERKQHGLHRRAASFEQTRRVRGRGVNAILTYQRIQGARTRILVLREADGSNRRQRSLLGIGQFPGVHHMVDVGVLLKGRVHQHDIIGRRARLQTIRKKVGGHDLEALPVQDFPMNRVELTAVEHVIVSAHRGVQLAHATGHRPKPGRRFENPQVGGEILAVVERPVVPIALAEITAEELEAVAEQRLAYGIGGGKKRIRVFGRQLAARQDKLQSLRRIVGKEKCLTSGVPAASQPDADFLDLAIDLRREVVPGEKQAADIRCVIRALQRIQRLWTEKSRHTTSPVVLSLFPLAPRKARLACSLRQSYAFQDPQEGPGDRGGEESSGMLCGARTGARRGKSRSSCAEETGNQFRRPGVFTPSLSVRQALPEWRAEADTGASAAMPCVQVDGRAHG